VCEHGRLLAETWVVSALIFKSLLMVLRCCVERLVTNRHRVFVTLPSLEMDNSERRFEIYVILNASL